MVYQGLSTLYGFCDLTAVHSGGINTAGNANRGGEMVNVKVNVGDKIVATRDLYYTVTKGTVMVVTKDMNDGYVCARIYDGDDNYSWFMPAGSYEPYGETPTLWRDMTDAEKGALLLAKHEGKYIEFKNNYDTPEWKYISDPVWSPECAYRIKPTPKVEQHAMRLVGNDTGDVYYGTITLIYGIPDPTSICMASV
jgi:hypothetical protein